MKRTASLLCALVICGCGQSSNQPNSDSAPPAGAPPADASYFCPLADRRYTTPAERAAGRKEAERLFAERRGFPGSDRNQAIGKAAVQVMAVLRGTGDHTPSQAEVEAELLSLPDAVEQLQKACKE